METWKDLIRQGRYAEALGTEYDEEPYSADIWTLGSKDYKRNPEGEVISFRKYGSKRELWQKVNEVLEVYPNAYVVISDANADWL